MINKETRILGFDYIKAIAILMVILCHIMQHCIKDYDDTLLFNIIWSMQIPAFMISSGYFSVSDKPLKQRMFRKIVYYLLPFFSYFLLNCYITNKSLSEGVYHLLNHLEFSLWYVFVLFVLSEQNGLAELITKQLIQTISVKYITCHTLVFFSITSFWLLMWHIKGSKYLGAKYIIYYALFFWLGWVYRNINTKTELTKIKMFFEKNSRIFLTISMIAYSLIMLKINIVNTPDTFIGTIPRVFASIFGCYILFFIVLKENLFVCVKNILALIGKLSLEIYFIHMLLVPYLVKTNIIAISVEGMNIIVVNFMYVIITSLIIIRIIKHSTFLDLALFGKLPIKKDINQ